MEQNTSQPHPEDFAQQKSFKEQRIRNATHLYYSRPEIQKTLFEFSKDREISPRYFDGFGKRPDALQYKNDVFELVKKGATSFHCSEELWENPLSLSTDLSKKELNDLRIGWDLVLDIDCKWFDYSKLAAQAIINVLKKDGIKNISAKFSGSKGWHILIPYRAFPKEINGIKTSSLFPELPRKLVAYLRFKASEEMQKILPESFAKDFKNVNIKRGHKCNVCNEIANEYKFATFSCSLCGISASRKMLSIDLEKKYKCPECSREFESNDAEKFFECAKCGINSDKNPENFSQSENIDFFELMGLDIVLVSPRHLFRMPYSLHEKTALASVVISPEAIKDFELKDASPMKVQVKNFMPEAKEGEAKEFVTKALDWFKDNAPRVEKISGKYADYKPIKLEKLNDENFPPCVKNILKGINDGKKRSLFVLINLFRSVGMEKDILEKKIFEWNQKNPAALKDGYIKSQLSWSYRKKPILPQNCREFYSGIGVCQPDNVCGRIKNPVNYVVKKNFAANQNFFAGGKKDKGSFGEKKDKRNFNGKSQGKKKVEKKKSR